VPTLVLDDGAVLVDSHLMLDYLDSLVPPERAMFPAREPARHHHIPEAGVYRPRLSPGRHGSRRSNRGFVSSRGEETQSVEL